MFVTFADGRHFTADRIVQEVSGLKLFDDILAYGPADLDDDFARKFHEHLAHKRGFGFWSWKPQVILQALQSAKDGDIIVYADAGCTVFHEADGILKSLLIDLSQSEGAVLATQNPTPFMTKHWTKADLLAVFGLENDQAALNSRQIEAGRVAMVRSDQSIRLIRKWLEIAADIHLIDDSPSRIPNDPAFVEHRHDQSIFSLLLREMPVLTGLEKVFDTTRLRALHAET